MVSNRSSYGRRLSFIFHISSCYTTTTADGSKKMPPHTSFGLSRELHRPEGMRLWVIQIRLVLTPPPFLKKKKRICINTKQEERGVKTTQGICDGFDKQTAISAEARKSYRVDIQKRKPASFSPRSHAPPARINRCNCAVISDRINRVMFKRVMTGWNEGSRLENNKHASVINHPKQAQGALF